LICFFYRPPEEIIAEKKAQEQALLQQQAQQHQQAHVVPFEQGNAQFRPHTEGSNEWVPIQQNANVPQENPWDLAQGESFRAGNNPQQQVVQPAGGSNWDS